MKLEESYFTKGSQDQLYLQNIQSLARDVLLAKLVKGTHGKVKIFNIRKNIVHEFTVFWDLRTKMLSEDLRFLFSFFNFLFPPLFR